jgi:hypothetical protein
MLRHSVLGLVGAGALSLGVGIAGAGAGATAAPGAHAARSIRMSESADMHLVKKSGSILKERGTASGTLPGSVSATFNTSNLARVTATVTFVTRGGSLTVTALGYPQSLSKFSGPISVKGGTGRFRHAHGSGSFSGTVNRRSWHIKVSAHGTITY